MREVAIIGDRFIAAFDVRGCDPRQGRRSVALRQMEMPWPDEPMEHGYARAGMDGLKEYMGDPEEVIAFIADAEIAVTQLAPSPPACSIGCRS